MAWVCIIIASLTIIYQDWKYRSIHLFPLAVLLIGLWWHQAPNGIMLLINMSFLFTQLVLITLYFSYKEMTLVDITKNQLGWADIIFFAIAACFFHPVNFILFIIAGMIISLGLHFLLMGKYHREQSVPLASYLSAFFLFVFLLDQSLGIELGHISILTL